MMNNDAVVQQQLITRCTALISDDIDCNNA